MRLTQGLRTAIVIGLGLLSCLLARGSFAEFRVDRSATAAASSPAVAIDAGGSFVVVWQSFDRNVFNVVGQRFDAEGERLGPEFVVSTLGRGAGAPSIGMSADGSFLVAWPAKLRGQPRVFGRFYGNDGSSGPPFQIDTIFRVPGVPTGRSIAVSMNEFAESLVTWDTGCGVVGQRFDALGERLGDKFQVGARDEDLAASPEGFCRGWTTPLPSVSLAVDGSFVVAKRYAYYYYYYSSFNSVIARRFDPSGAPSSGELDVRSPPGSLSPLARLDAPATATSPDGGFIVTWRGGDQQSTAVRGRLYESDNTPSVDLAIVSADYVAFDSLEPAVATAADGSFLVVWRLGKVMGRWYDAYGVELGEAFTIGATPAQGRPSVAVSANGSAVVVWESPARRRSPAHVFLERLSVP